MDEEISIIDQNTRREYIKNFLIKNKKKIYFFLVLILISIFSIFLYLEYVERQKLVLSNKFIKASLNYDVQKKAYYLDQFTEIIDSNNSTYGPLTLFFLIDNNILETDEEINRLFDKIINNTKLEKEIKNLMIYKKGLINASYQSENEILKTLEPLTNSDSVWKPHALLLLGDYFLSKGKNQKARDFYTQILISSGNNENILMQARSRIRENFGK